MSQRKIFCWDTLGWIKVFAWVQIVGNFLFVVLAVLSLSFVARRPNDEDAERESGLATAAFVTLMVFIFLSFMGIGMGILLLRGLSDLLQHDTLLKAWIIYAASSLILVISCGGVVGALSIIALSSKG